MANTIVKEYIKDNNKCPYCNDFDYSVFSSYKEQDKEVFRCCCNKTNKDFNVIKKTNIIGYKATIFYNNQDIIQKSSKSVDDALQRLLYNLIKKYNYELDKNYGVELTTITDDISEPFYFTYVILYKNKGLQYYLNSIFLGETNG